MRPLPTPCLVLLTDRCLLPAGMPLGQAVAPAVTGGVDLVVMRETDLPVTPRTTLAGFVRDGIRGRAQYLISEDVQLAAEVGADGVHLDSGEQAAKGARAAIGPDRLLGIRMVAADEVGAAQGAGADYVLVELDWSDPDGALRTLGAFIERTGLPVIAGTDMPLDQVALILQAGAGGIAISRPAMEAYDRTAACRAYRDALDAVRPSSRS